VCPERCANGTREVDTSAQIQSNTVCIPKVSNGIPLGPVTLTGTCQFYQSAKGWDWTGRSCQVRTQSDVESSMKISATIAATSTGYAVTIPKTPPPKPGFLDAYNQREINGTFQLASPSSSAAYSSSLPFTGITVNGTVSLAPSRLTVAVTNVTTAPPGQMCIENLLDGTGFYQREICSYALTW
jgi:hypothetical protein